MIIRIEFTPESGLRPFERKLAQSMIDRMERSGLYHSPITIGHVSDAFHYMAIEGWVHIYADDEDPLISFNARHILSIRVERDPTPEETEAWIANLEKRMQPPPPQSDVPSGTYANQPKRKRE